MIYFFGGEKTKSIPNPNKIISLYSIILFNKKISVVYLWIYIFKETSNGGGENKYYILFCFLSMKLLN